MDEFNEQLQSEKAKLPNLLPGQRWKLKSQRSAEDRVSDAVYVDFATSDDRRVYLVAGDSVIIYEKVDTSPRRPVNSHAIGRNDPLGRGRALPRGANVPLFSSTANKRAVIGEGWPPVSPTKMANQLFETSVHLDVGATFSPCRLYRYQLWRIWDDKKLPLNVIGLNPSTADEKKDDPTIRRCIDFAKSWGYGGLVMTNLFAFRATVPRDMKKATEPIGVDNDQWLKESAAGSGMILAAWGNHGAFRDRDKDVRAFLYGLRCFRITSKGQPEHPLYMPKTIQPILLESA